MPGIDYPADVWSALLQAGGRHAWTGERRPPARRAPRVVARRRRSSQLTRSDEGSPEASPEHQGTMMERDTVAPIRVPCAPATPREPSSLRQPWSPHGDGSCGARRAGSCRPPWSADRPVGDSRFPALTWPGAGRLADPRPASIDARRRPVAAAPSAVSARSAISGAGGRRFPTTRRPSSAISSTIDRRVLHRPAADPQSAAPADAITRRCVDTYPRRRAWNRVRPSRAALLDRRPVVTPTPTAAPRSR